MQVEYSTKFWESVVELFDEIRGPRGEASLNDFENFELPKIEIALKVTARVETSIGPTALFFQGSYFPLYSIYYESTGVGTLRVIDMEVDPDFGPKDLSLSG